MGIGSGMGICTRGTELDLGLDFGTMGTMGTMGTPVGAELGEDVEGLDEPVVGADLII